MIKWIGMILLVISGGAAGFGKSHELKRRVLQLEQAIRFLYTAETEMRYAALPLEGIVKKHRKDFFFAEDYLMNLENGVLPPKAWENALKAAKSSALRQDDRKHLLEFGHVWGSTDTEGQLMACKITRSFLEQQLKEAQKENETKSRLYQALGILGGIGSAILLG